MNYHPQHLAKLEEVRASFSVDDEALGPAPAPCYAYIAAADQLDGLPRDRCSRQMIFDYLAQRPPIRLACAAILAWGGMNRLHARKLFEQTDWLDVAERLRRGELNRTQAYAEFARLRRTGKLPGMGPAYFTKLIFFLMPRGETAAAPGYIMDQWTACSVNLLLGQDRIRTDATYRWTPDGAVKSDFTVNDHNDEATYGLFCEVIEDVASRCNLAADEAELMLISAGGKQPKPWRQHVLQNRAVPAVAGG